MKMGCRIVEAYPIYIRISSTPDLRWEKMKAEIREGVGSL